MKTIVLSLLTFFSVWFAENDGLTITNERVNCTISQATTHEQLKQYKAELIEKKNIQLEIKQIEVNQDGLITNLSISVDCRDGFKGSARQSFKDEKTKMNFYRVYEKNTDSAFGIGELQPESIPASKN